MTSKNSKTPSDKTAARPDLRRLAGHLGVSQTTVSCVLNGSAKNCHISEKTQQRVLAAAAKLYYKANALARSLRRKTVGVMVPEISEGYIMSAATNNPPLTTVRQPLQEMGRAAASTLLQMINNERQAWPKHPMRVLPTFVERQSTATVWQDRKSAPSPGLSVSAFTQR